MDSNWTKLYGKWTKILVNVLKLDFNLWKTILQHNKTNNIDIFPKTDLSEEREAEM